MAGSDSRALMLPEPKEVSIADAKEKLIPAAERARRAIEERRSIEDARELCRQLEAFRKYLHDKEGRDLLAAECRRTEVLIGKLLGPAEVGANQYSEALLASNASDVSRIDRHKFRLMAAHEDYVEELLTQDEPILSRDRILEKIQQFQRISEDGEIPPGLPPEVKIETVGDIYADLDGIESWLRKRRDRWPQECRAQFCRLVRNILEVMEEEGNAD